MVFRRFLHRLQQPYPISASRISFLRSSLFGGLFVMLFLFFFRPFGSDASLDHLTWLRISAEYGAVTVLVSLVWGSFILAMPGIFREETWQVWKEMVGTLVFVGLIALGNMFYSDLRYHNPSSWSRFWWWLLITWGVGIFPVVFGILLKQMRLMRRYSMEASTISGKMEHHLVERLPTGQAVVLHGDNQGETLALAADQLRYLAAADNYVQVFYMQQDQLKSKMLRTTLKKMEESLAGYPQFFRCHRTYLVNLDMVQRVSGNAQGYRLHLEAVQETVPVSRNLNEAIQLRFGNVDRADAH